MLMEITLIQIILTGNVEMFQEFVLNPMIQIFILMNFAKYSKESARIKAMNIQSSLQSASSMMSQKRLSSLKNLTFKIDLRMDPETTLFLR